MLPRTELLGFDAVPGWDVAAPARRIAGGRVAGGLPANRVVVALDEVWLATSGTAAPEHFSRPFRLWGNAASLSTLLINKTGAREAQFTLEGSFDGTTWRAIVTQSSTGWGYLSSSATNLADAWLRVRARLATGFSNRALFTCFIGMARL